MLRFIDGFDHYPIADILLKWSRLISNTILFMTSSPVRYTGSGQAIRMRGGVLTKILDSQTTWIMGCGMRFAIVTTAGIIMAIYNGSQLIGYLEFNGSGKLRIVSQNASGTTVLGTGTTSILPNIWYYIEFKYQCAATTGLINATCKIAGVTEISIVATSGGSTTAGTTADTVAIGMPDTNSDGTFDDFYCCDTTGTVNNDFLGDVRIETLYPSAVGFQSDFTRNTGTSNWSAVSDAQENADTTYNAASSVNAIDSYGMTDMATTPPLIMGVQTTTMGRKDDAGAKSYASFVRISTTNYFSSTFQLYDSYAFASKMYELSPATSTAWTTSEVNGLECGVKILS